MGSFNDFIDYSHYSSLNGKVTTDASGNITDWDLRFTLYNGGQITINTTTDTINGIDLPTAQLLLSSDPASTQTIYSVVKLNGEIQEPPKDFHFDGADTVFIREGPIEYLYYTSQPGSVVLVPEPETYAMLLAGLMLISMFVRRRNMNII